MKQGELVLYLVRHGETEYNAQHKLAGWVDTPLTPQGQTQAASLQPLLQHHHFDGIWSSDLCRAVETARLAGFTSVQDPRLRELDFGELDGLSWTSLSATQREAFRDFENFAAPGGESMQAMRNRVEAFLDALPAGKHAIFTHGGVINMLMRQVGVTKFVGNCAQVTMQWKPVRTLMDVKECETEP